MNAQSTLPIEPDDWAERNQRWLIARIDRLRQRLDRLHAGGTVEVLPEDAAHPMNEEFEPALDHCAKVFGLSDFERNVLLLCAGVSLDADLARTVADMTGNASGSPTFSLWTAMARSHGSQWVQSM